MLNFVYTLVQVLHKLIDDFVEVESLIVSKRQEDGVSSKQFDVQVQVEFVIERSCFGFQLKVKKLYKYLGILIR